MHHHGHSVMPHSNVFINIRRTLVSLVAVRALESRLLSAIVFHMGLQGLLVGIASVAQWTTIRHLTFLPDRSVLVLHLVTAASIIHPQNIQNTGIVRLRDLSYEQGRGEITVSSIREHRTVTRMEKKIEFGQEVGREMRCTTKNVGKQR